MMRTRTTFLLSGTLAALLTSAAAGSAYAQAPPAAPAPPPEGPRIVVTYVDVVPSSESQAIALLKGYRDATRKEEGSQSAEIWQQDGPRGRFLVVEEWRDEASRQKHRDSPHVKQFHDKLTPLRITSYDERVHTVYAVASPPSVSADAVLVATHVDVVPNGLPKARELLTAQVGVSRKDKGNIRFDVLQGARMNHFTVLEAWSDERAREAHISAVHSKGYREGLRETAVDGAPYDERLYRVVR
jgi:quinol monooxygenase YgiN